MTNRADWRITWAMEQLQRSLGERLSVPELAARVNLSPSRFRDLFSAQAGVGPAQYLQQLRLRRARTLIERTFLTVKEVMVLVGYKDPSHFSRDFRHFHGVPPSSLRGRGIATPLPSEAGPPADKPTEPAARRIRQPRAREPGFQYV